jgi:riboflavin kinase/FMN adenylyltransferase
MQVINDLTSLNTPLAATIGNFDGVHLGHQALLETLIGQAKQRGLQSAVVSFEPSPQEHFLGANAPARLTRLEEKVALLGDTGVDYFIVLPFDAELANLPAEQFVQDILQQCLHINYLLIGDDFHFGKNRLGNYALLQSMASEAFAVENLPTERLYGERISSSRIRLALEEGDLVTAERLLGRPYSMLGSVAHGEQRGRTIGFPTANIHLERHRSPVLGVYAVKVFGIGSQVVYGVANVGNRPTVDGTRSLLEVHLFDFDADIYGAALKVVFCHKVRDEQRFASFEVLKEQIQRDMGVAKKYFQINEPT